MMTRTLLRIVVSMVCLSKVADSADGDRAAAEQWLLRAVESSGLIKTESAISHAADKMAHAQARLGQVDDAFQQAKRITNPQLKLYALTAVIQAAVNADQDTELMVGEARQTLKGKEGSFNDAAMKNLLRIAETKQKTLPAIFKQPEPPPLEQLQKAFDAAANRREKLAAFQPLMTRSLQTKSFDSLEQAIEETIQAIEQNPLPDKSSKFGTYGDSAEIAKIRVANLYIASKLAEEGQNDEAARHLALADAVTYLAAAGKLSDPRPLSCAIAAVSVGVVDGRVRVDLPYEEDSRAEVDMNVVATDTGTFVEIQGTGEGATFPRTTLNLMLDAAMGACEKLFIIQREALALPYPGVLPDGPAAKKAFGS